MALGELAPGGATTFPADSQFAETGFPAALTAMI